MTARLCGCGCGASLAGMRADAVYHSEACKKRAERARSRDKAGTVHPLANARADQEASELNRQLGELVRAAIIRRLFEPPYRVHADDLESDFPAEHVERCRRLVGGQFGALASAGYVTERERRKSSVPSRKGAKSGVYELTRSGREKFAGVGSANREGTGGRSTAPLDRPAPTCSGDASSGARSSSTVDPGGHSSAVSEAGSAKESAQLFEFPTASPTQTRSAQTDPEAA